MTLRLLVDDVPTVLARFALLLSRREVELTSLSVHRMDSPGIAVLLVELETNAAMVDHLSRRLSRMINVLEVNEWAKRTSDPPQLCDLHGVQV